MRLFGFLLVFTTCLSFSNLVSAQVSNNTELSVSPAVIEIAVNPGDTVERDLLITNSSNNSVPVVIEQQPLVGFEDQLEAKIYLSDASKWIDLADENLLFAPKESKKIKIKFIIPKEAAPGGHYAQLNVRALILENLSSDRTTLTVPEIAVSVFITVSGDIKESFGLEEINLFPAQVTANNDEKIEFLVYNNGNVHGLITPILILERNGTEVYRKQLKSELILPSLSKKFSDSWTTPDKNGVYKAHVEFKKGNTNEVEYSNNETVLVSPNIWKIGLTGVITMLSVHLFRRRNNLETAVRILLHGK